MEKSRIRTSFEHLYIWRGEAALVDSKITLLLNKYPRNKEDSILDNEYR